jgi:hypothetical protein
MTTAQVDGVEVDSSDMISMIGSDSGSANGIELRMLRFKLSVMNEELLMTKKALRERTAECMRLHDLMKRSIGDRLSCSGSPPDPRPLDSLNSVASPEPSASTSNDWVRLRLDFLAVSDELDMLRSNLRMSEESLRDEREARIREIDQIKNFHENSNLIENLRNSLEIEMKRNNELSDEISKLKQKIKNSPRSPSPPITFNTPSFPVPRPRGMEYIKLQPPSILTSSPILQNRNIVYKQQ